MSVSDHTTPVVYREIADVPGYRFGSDGSCWSRWLRGQHCEVLGDQWRRLNPCSPSKRGYYRVWVKIDGEPVVTPVHTLVLRAFKGEPQPGRNVGRHLDDNKLNNKVENLEWGTHRDNVADSIRNGTHAVGERRTSAKFTEDKVREIRRRYEAGEGVTSLAREHGVNHNAIGCIVRRKTWKHVV